MKKTYEKPAISVVLLKYNSYLLAGSPVGLFDDDGTYSDWDIDGGQ